MEDAPDCDTSSIRYTWNGSQRIEKGMGTVRNQRKNRDHPDCWGRPEYWVESWRPENICYYQDSIKSLSTDASVKTSQGVK